MGGKLEAILKGQFYKRPGIEFRRVSFTYGARELRGMEPRYLLLKVFWAFACNPTFISLTAGVLNLACGVPMLPRVISYLKRLRLGELILGAAAMAANQISISLQPLYQGFKPARMVMNR